MTPFYIEFKRTHTKKLFSFPDIPAFENYSFEKLSEQNFEQLYLLFEGDESPFVDARFKSHDEAKEYATFISICGAFVAKHGGQDWFFKAGNEYAGILHLYDLSLENWNDNNKRAWLGFATKEKFRGKGISLGIVKYFIRYVFDYYPAIDFIHSMTLRENTLSKSFLTKCGFATDNEERLSKDYDFFLLERNEKPDFVANKFDESEWTR